EWKRGNDELALRHYRSAFEIFQNSGDFVHAGLMLNSMGVTLKNLGKTDEAVSTLKLAAEMNHSTKERLLEGHSFAVLGEVYSEAGNQEQAAQSFRASLTIRREIGDRIGEGWMLYHLARVSVSLLEKSQALEYFSEAVRIANECEEKDLI